MLNKHSNTHPWIIVEKVLFDRWWAWDSEGQQKLKWGGVVFRKQFPLTPRHCLPFAVLHFSTSGCLSHSFPQLSSSWKRIETEEKKLERGLCNQGSKGITCSSRRGAGDAHMGPHFPLFSSGGGLGLLPSCWGLTKSDLKSTQVYTNQLPLGTGWRAYN